jgi:hypothetical protein
MTTNFHPVMPQPTGRLAPSLLPSPATPTDCAALSYWPASPLLNHRSACPPTSHTSTTASTARTTTPSQILCKPAPSVATSADSRQHPWQPTIFEATAPPGHISPAARTAKSAAPASHITNGHQHRHRLVVAPHSTTPTPMPPTPNPLPRRPSRHHLPRHQHPKKATAHWHKLCKNGFGRARLVRNPRPPVGLVELGSEVVGVVDDLSAATVEYPLLQ